MLQVILKFDQNLMSFWLQNWSKIDQKSIKKWYRIQSRFRKRYFFDFLWFFTNFGPNLVPKWSVQMIWNRFWKRFRTPSGFQRLFVIDFGPSNDQNCDLASTKCTLVSVLNVENQGFCNAFSNFLTFFNQKGPLGVQN